MKKYNSEKKGESIVKIFTKLENDDKLVNEVVSKFPDDYIEWWPYAGSTLNRSEFLCYIGLAPELHVDNLPLGIRCSSCNELEVTEIFAVC